MGGEAVHRLGLRTAISASSRQKVHKPTTKDEDSHEAQNPPGLLHFILKEKSLGIVEVRGNMRYRHGLF